MRIPAAGYLRVPSSNAPVRTPQITRRVSRVPASPQGHRTRQGAADNSQVEVANGHSHRPGLCRSRMAPRLRAGVAAGEAVEAMAAVPRTNILMMMKMSTGRICPMLPGVVAPLPRLLLLLRRTMTHLLLLLPMRRGAMSVATGAAGGGEGEVGDGTMTTVNVSRRRVGSGADALDKYSSRPSRRSRS